MWADIGNLKILLWMFLVGAACWILRVIVFAKKPKRTPTEANLKNEGNTRLNLPASKANPARKATVRIGPPPKPPAAQCIRISMPSGQGPDPPTPRTKQTVRISMPSKQGQVPEDPFEICANLIVSTPYREDEPKEKKYGITGPALLPIENPGMLPSPVPVHLGIPQVVFRMRIMQQLLEEQLVSEEEYQEKKAEILRYL